MTIRQEVANNLAGLLTDQDNMPRMPSELVVVPRTWLKQAHILASKLYIANLIANIRKRPLQPHIKYGGVPPYQASVLELEVIIADLRKGE